MLFCSETNYNKVYVNMLQKQNKLFLFGYKVYYLNNEMLSPSPFKLNITSNNREVVRFLGKYLFCI